jgi:lysophospholipase L1-like esterase
VHRFRYLALGDSYTIGEAVSPSGRFPDQLTRRLRAEGIDVGDPEIIARTGWTTDELAAEIASRAPQGPYDLVTLLIGVNNQYRGRGAGEYRPEFRSLLHRAIALAGSPRRVIVVSIPDWGVTPFAAREQRNATRVAAEIDAFNAAARAEADAAGVAFIDVTAISRRAANDDSLLAEDGLHPSATMYEAWTDEIRPVALRLFRE